MWLKVASDEVGSYIDWIKWRVFFTIIELNFISHSGAMHHEPIDHQQLHAMGEERKGGAGAEVSRELPRQDRAETREAQKTLHCFPVALHGPFSSAVLAIWYEPRFQMKLLAHKLKSTPEPSFCQMLENSA